MPEETIGKIKKRMTLTKRENEIKRKYNEEPKEIVQKYIEEKMDISIPAVMIGYKDNNVNPNDVRKDLALQIIGDILFGKCSDFYEKLYNKGYIISPPSFNYEFSKTYAHFLIQVQTDYIDEVFNIYSEQIEYLKKYGIDDNKFERAKKKVYGELIRDFNDVSDIATIIVSEYFKGISPFDYIDNINTVNKEYVQKIFEEIFVEEMKVISVIKPNKEEKDESNKIS